MRSLDGEVLLANFYIYGPEKYYIYIIIVFKIYFSMIGIYNSDK